MSDGRTSGHAPGAMRVYIYLMRRGVLVILLLLLSLGLMAGEVLAAETSKTAPVASDQTAPKTRWRSLVLWLSSPREWFHSRKATEKNSTPGMITGTRHDQAASPDTQRQLPLLGQQGRDQHDSFKTFLFIRPKPGLSDIGTPGTLQDKPGQSAKDGCAGYGNDRNSSDDGGRTTLADLSLGMCLRF